MRERTKSSTRRRRRSPSTSCALCLVLHSHAVIASPSPSSQPIRTSCFRRSTLCSNAKPLYPHLSFLPVCSLHCDSLQPSSTLHLRDEAPPVCGERDGVLQGPGPPVVPTTTSVWTPSGGTSSPADFMGAIVPMNYNVMVFNRQTFQ